MTETHRPYTWQPVVAPPLKPVCEDTGAPVVPAPAPAPVSLRPYPSDSATQNASR